MRFGPCPSCSAEAVAQAAPHPLGGILTACAAAGLRLVTLEELPYSIREPEYDLYQGRRAQIPMSYSLVAVRER